MEVGAGERWFWFLFRNHERGCNTFGHLLAQAVSLVEDYKE
jgi:hypothetical protein